MPTRLRILRSRLAHVAALVLVAAAWLYLAPTQIGGSASYVATRGISMEPRFHTGDLALLRPAGSYRVGDVVGYRSSALRTVVLHRVIGRQGDRYVFKGDNNNFIDPVRPRRRDLVGKLWIRAPRGGLVLAWVHSPGGAALLAGGVALLTLVDGDRRRRRRGRRGTARVRPSPPPRDPSVLPSLVALPGVTPARVLRASAGAAVAFLVLGVLAFGRPASRPIAVRTPYTEHVRFGYRAHPPGGTVYPKGIVRTGDPVFLRLVDRVRVVTGYRLVSEGSVKARGTLRVTVRLSSATGWSATVLRAAPVRLSGGRARSQVLLNLSQLRDKIAHVERLTGVAAGNSYSLTVDARVHATGTVASRPLSTDYTASLPFQLDGLQLRAGSTAPGAAGSSAGGFTPSRRGHVTASGRASNALIDGALAVSTARWIAVLGLLAVAACALAAARRHRRAAGASGPQLPARYRQLIVPIAGLTPSAERAPIDVTSIDALVQLAERSERLILHHHHQDADTYFVDDEGTLYRYETRRGQHSPPATGEDRAAGISA